MEAGRWLVSVETESHRDGLEGTAAGLDGEFVGNGVSGVVATNQFTSTISPNLTLNPEITVWNLVGIASYRW
jgi:hypothetical protein